MAAVIVWMLLHFVLAAAGTWLARRYSVRRNLLDQPGERRSHAVATPRGGGISIVVGILLGTAWLALRWPQHAVLLSCFGIGLVLVAGVGWLDDHRPLSPWLRLAVQALAALVLAWAVHRTTGSGLSTAVAFGLAMVLVNVWNFMDGIDGLAASQAAIAAAALAWALGSGPWAWLAIALVAGVAGFLPFNFPKATIFLGDVGSGALGYVLAMLIVAAGLWGRTHWFLLLLPVSAFLIDAGFTLVMRMLRGERWWAAHVQHAYQLWARRRGGHVLVTWAYATFSLLSVALMLFASTLPETSAILACFVWYGLAILVWVRMRKDVRLNKEAGQ